MKAFAVLLLVAAFATGPALGVQGYSMLEDVVVDEGYLGDFDFSTLTQKSFPVGPGGKTVSVLIVYSNDRAAVMSDDALRVVHEDQLAFTNQVLVNSNVPHRVALAGSVHIDYNESGSLLADLSWVAMSPDVIAFRWQYGADVVLLAVHNHDGDLSGAANKAFLVDEMVGQENLAFGVFAAPELVGNVIVAHELGHIFGAEHDVNPNNPSASTFSGFPVHGKSWANMRTIMGVSCLQPPRQPGDPECLRVPYYSDPEITYEGEPVGRYGEAEVAGWLLIESMAVIADFFDEQQGETALFFMGRFIALAAWTDHGGRSGDAYGVQLTDKSGYFWFFNEDNIELVIKVLDGRPVNGHFWVFVAGLTNVQVTLIVVDTVTGQQNQYINYAGDRYEPIQDTEAFPDVGEGGSGSQAPGSEATLEILPGRLTGSSRTRDSLYFSAGYDEDGDGPLEVEDYTIAAYWESSKPGVIRFQGTGWWFAADFICLSPGTATITATLFGITSTAEASCT